MNQGRIWCVVKPTVGLPLLLGSVSVIALLVHYAVLSNTSNGLPPIGVVKIIRGLSDWRLAYEGSGRAKPDPHHTLSRFNCTR